MPAQLLVEHIPTPLAPMLAEWTDKGLYRFVFQHSLAAKDVNLTAAAELQASGAQARAIHSQSLELRAALEGYFQQEPFEYDLNHLDWSEVTEFSQDVLRACYEIKPGQTLTYGELARLAGSPGAARAVGAIMARNRWPLLIPCHRVLGAGGKLTGYSGAGGLETKRKLLDMEQSRLELPLEAGLLV